MKSTILIVDDFENTRRIIKESLSDTEYEILQAGNGLEALKIFNARRVDLLITDLNMPEMNGIELIDAVRKDQHHSFIPILLLTTERNAEKLKKAEEMRVTAIINKPFQIGQFRKIVEKCLKQSVR